MYTRSDTLARSLGTRIDELSKRKLALEQDLDKPEYAVPNIDVGTAFAMVREQLENPLLLYKTGRLDAKKLVVKQVFTSPLVYERGIGFGTPDLSLPYLISRRFDDGYVDLVDPKESAWDELGLLVREWACDMERVGGASFKVPLPN